MRGAARCWMALAVLLAVGGCGRRQPQPPSKEPPAPAAPSLEFGGSVIRIADPKGRWTFEARSATVKAQSAGGPYSLSPAEGTYQEKGKEPVHMRAQFAEVQKQAGQVVLEGSVAISSAGWTLEAEQVTYDLNTGKVVAPGRTKLTFEPRAAQQSRASGGRGAHQ